MMTALKEIRLHCPVCDREFTSQQVVTTNAFRGKRTDFHPRAAGIQPTRYDVHLCPTCGYAGKLDCFADDLDVGPIVVAHVWNELAPRISTVPLTGSERFEQAAKVALWSETPSVGLGDLYLHAAWCCVDEGDIEAERYFRRLAAWAFEHALDEYDAVDAEDRPLLTYLVGELWRRVGDEDRSRDWFERVPDTITTGDQLWIAEIARQQKDDPREWFAGDAHRATSELH